MDGTKQGKLARHPIFVFIHTHTWLLQYCKSWHKIAAMDLLKPAIVIRKRLLGAAAGCLSLFLLSRGLLWGSSSLPPFTEPPQEDDEPSKLKQLPEASSPSQHPYRSAAAPAPSPSAGGGVYQEAEQAAGSPAQGACDLFDGSWVYDLAGYPLYEARECPFLSDQVTCRRNGRPDSGYEHWRWRPWGCGGALRLGGGEMLEQCRDKQVVLVGDSLNRNMWESLACILYAAVPDRSRALVDDASAEHKIFRAVDYNCSVEFYWSPFLVDLEEKGDQTRALKLDQVAATSSRFVGADVLVFNTGHWWTHTGKFRAWDHFERNGKSVQMEGEEAFNRAFGTWTRWVDQNVDSNRTRVFFRSISPEHKSMNWCYNQTSPITTETYVQLFPRSMISIVESNLRRTRTPIAYLNITRLSEFRRDAHPSVFTAKEGKLLTMEQRRQPGSYADCSHWCLPGVPDTWNVLLFASWMRALPIVPLLG